MRMSIDKMRNLAGSTLIHVSAQMG